MKKLSVIVLSWCKAGSDKLHMLKGTLDSIRDCTESDYELIVVDNGSDMVEASELMRERADLYLRVKDNRGFGPGMDLGFLLATGEYVAMVNDDIVVAHGWDTRLIESAGDGFAMPALLPLGPLPELDTPAKVAKLDEWGGKEENASSKPVVFSAGAGFGATFLAKRSVFASVTEDGLVFDPRFEKAMWEDSDLWMRCDRAGVNRVCDPRTWVWHQGNGTVWKLDDFPAIYDANRARFNEKWGSSR